MSYILRYFDSLVDEYDYKVFTHWDNKKIYAPGLIEEIKEEALKARTAFREVYYSKIEPDEMEVFFSRILKRLMFYKKEIEKRVYQSQFTLFRINHPQNFHVKLENYYQLYDEILFLINIVVNEIGLDVENNGLDKEKLEYKIEKRDSNEIYRDHSMLKMQIFKENKVSEELQKKYRVKFTEDDIDNTRKNIKNLYPHIYRLPYNFILDVDLNIDAIDMTFEDHVQDFIGVYVYENLSFRRFFYLQIAQDLKAKTKTIKKQDEIEEFVVDTLIFNNLCEDLIIPYFKSKIYKIAIYKEGKELHAFLKKQKDRLVNIAQSETIKRYRQILYKDDSKPTLISQLDELFTDLIDHSEFENNNEPNLSNTYQDPKNKIFVDLDEKQLGIMIGALYETGILYRNRTKDTKIISEIISLKGKGPIEANQLRNLSYERDEAAVKTVLKKFQKMVSLLIKEDVNR
ncbi:hypothetical protein [Marinilabilia salmonicolor]|uniref:hypothetical protein n=1 Tax=Marinilabilia salmonicolor TaxID=989 RepID=UPI00029A4ECD|nr:hypothetical protein [Marinilabilia salmonicolor]